MRFMMLYKPGRETDAPPSEEEQRNLGQLIEKLARSGKLLSTDGLQSSAKGARVEYDGGKLTVTDGPFAETKELVAGYAIVQADSKEEAIELAREFLSVMREGQTEIRLMHDMAAFEAGEQQAAAART